MWQCWRYSSFGIDRRPSRRRRCRGEDQDEARGGLTEFTGAFCLPAGSGAGSGGKRTGEFGRGGKRPIKKPAIGGGLSLGGKRRDSLATIASYINSLEHSVAIHTQ